MGAPDGSYAVVEVVDGTVAVAALVVDPAAPGLFVVDAMARLQVAARRLGWTVRLRRPDAALRELVEVAGLSGVLLLDELGWQAERGEQPGVQEVVQADQPPA